MLSWIIIIVTTVLFGLYIYNQKAQEAAERRIVAKTDVWLTSLRATPPSRGTSPWYQKRVLVVVNPFSGRTPGQSLRLLRTIVAPVLKYHQVRYTVIETERANHALEFFSDKKNDLSQYDLCMLISGDGLLSEVLNGLVSRHMPAGLQPSSPDFHATLKKALHALPIALLPGGTSNGLVTSLFGHIDAVDILRRVLSSEPKSVDIMSIQTPVIPTKDGVEDPLATKYSRTTAKNQADTPPAVKVDMLTFLYGVVADNDNFAERTFRSLPAVIRTTLAPLAAIALNRRYGATVRIKPLPFTKSEAQVWNYTDTASFESWSVDSAWRVLRARFQSFVVMNVKWPAHDVMFAPSAEVDDGALYACVMRRESTSLLHTLQIFLKLADGSQNADDAVEYIKIDEFVVHPEENRGNMIISGEPLPVQSVHGKVQPKAACFVY